jgi:DNA polymerase-3 subunit alpha
MTINVPGLKPDAYAEMRRESKSWGLYINDQKVDSINHTAAFAALGRDHYMILGTGKDEGRVIRFADPHRHSDCSLLDGMTQIPEMVALTEYAGALTDHGVMYGFLTYYKAMKAAGKKPIIGFEAYMEGLDGQLKGNHLVLLAKNEQGVKNLFKLTSGGYDNFKRKPHVTWEMLEEYHEGVIALSACLAGVIPSALLNENEDAARYAIKRFISIFGTEDFYIELQRHYIHEEDVIRPKLIQLAEEYGLKVVASTDSHYPRKEDARAHELLLCLQTDKTMDDPTHMKFPGTGYHIHTSEEMEKLFADCPEALDNTLELAEKCNVELKLNEVNLPKYEIPKRFANASEYMVYLAKKGFNNHFGGTEHEKDPVYLERFDYEIKMIQQMGFESYFIIVWDFIDYCRKHDIYVGPGRGSAAGSLVAYCLGITDVDPIKYNLLFERFLNPERVSWPD